jgi:hypothetical protein
VQAACQATNAAALKQLAKDVQSGQQLLAFATDTGLQALQALEALGADTPEDVAAQERTYHQICEQLAHTPLALAADLAVGAYLLPKTPDTAALVATSETLHLALTAPHRLADSAHPQHAAVAAARAACQQARVLHWPLAFAQVFAAGGFDCVLGNPPWEMLQLDPQEFFASRAPEVANAQHMAARDNDDCCIGSMATRRCTTSSNFVQRRAHAPKPHKPLSVDSSGRFPASGFGRLNLAYLFAELFLDMKRADGRAGLIVPSGIATDSFTQHLFNKITLRAI